jgi:ABC-type transport system involved in cytochrome c biogenesis permease subunit
MWAITGILLTGSVIAWLEAPYLLRAKMLKELLIFALLLTTGVTVTILYTLRVPLPNPLDWITYIHKPVSDLLFGMLK